MRFLRTIGNSNLMKIQYHWQTFVCLAYLTTISFAIALDPADVEEVSQRPQMFSPQSTAMNASAQEEEISLLLGTLQVRKGFSLTFSSTNQLK